MRRFVAPSLLLFATTVVGQRQIIRETFDISNGVVSLDGFNRSAIVINNITPGPILTGSKGQDFEVTVNNRLDDPDMRRSTSIHWHGILQPRTAYDDGPAFVTQCPIAPNNSYTYSIKTGNQAGTFWYHSHLSSQYLDGLRGALVIYDPEDPHRDLYNVDDSSTIISLTDWYHNASEGLGHAWLNGTAPEPVPDSNLFNGVGRFANRGGYETLWPVINVTQNQRYRLRIINMSAMTAFNFGVQGHTLTVVEADGENHNATDVTSLSIAAGQRYSVVLNANQDVNNYWIAYPSNIDADTCTNLTRVNPNYNCTEAFAVLHYDTAPEITTLPLPDFRPNNSVALREDSLVPLISPTPPDENDVTVIPLVFRPTDFGSPHLPGGRNNWTVNGSQYTPPTLPTLLRILRDNATEQSDFPNSENTYVIPPNATVIPSNATIDVQLIGGPNHPFHLHGHTFQVIKTADPGSVRNTINPPIRDTVNTNFGEAADAVTIRFRTDNPGPWILHCHKDWHLEAGLAVVFAEAPGEQRVGDKSINPPQAWNDLCDIYERLPEDEK